MGEVKIKVKRGRAGIKLKGREDAFPVWISDFIDKVLLGVVVSESLGFDVDPTTGTLKKRPLLLYNLSLKRKLDQRNNPFSKAFCLQKGL